MLLCNWIPHFLYLSVRMGSLHDGNIVFIFVFHVQGHLVEKFMAKAAPSPLSSSVEKTNGAKLSKLLIDGGTTVLRRIFDDHYPPTNLIADLNAKYFILNNLLRRRVLNGHQWDTLFSPGGVAPDSNTFDIALLFVLLTNICEISPPSSGWHAKPPPCDISREANLARVKLYRNVLYGHVTTTGVDTAYFSALWNGISGVLADLGLDQADVDRLKAENGGKEDYVDVLIEWANSEEDIKSQLENIHSSQTKPQLPIEGVHQSLTKTLKTLEGVQQTQATAYVHDVLVTLEEVGQSQVSTRLLIDEFQKENSKNMDVVATDLKEITSESFEEGKCNDRVCVEVPCGIKPAFRCVESVVKTRLIIDEVWRENTKNMDEVAADLKEVNETVDSLEEGKYNDWNYEVLQGDIKSSVKLMKEKVKKYIEGLKEIRELSEILKDKRDEDKEDESLQNRAKSEFSRDIECHLQKFQEGTRDWAFKIVENWLDERSSPNRVMVISGNAGFGKSVIAAKVCKRLQETGRLAGGHFCQYNNLRHDNPQIMLQSLAYNLSRALPEYKQALMEQLSRNLGTDLNNMAVDELFALLFINPLSAVSDPGRNMLLVIDGLDEIEDKHRRNELLDVTANHFCKLPIWIRFLVTTRPAVNVVEKLRHLNAFEFNLKCNDVRNLEDVRVFFRNKLEHVVKEADVGESEFLDRLVLKSRGLMVLAHVLALTIGEITSVVHQGDPGASLPLAIFSENSFSALEYIHRTQAKTQQSIDEVCQNVKEIDAGPKEIKEAVESLRDEKNKDRVEEFLGKLTKSEFRQDIEYYAQRFQEGTREWVFDRIQNWLDDRTSQNRVMVISGNAGMGKSVISAVVCKRMQEAGRLSGSHFCQYNNVRYCKPQLMIQSLACHLSHALPEYKKALEERLSRNLGTDLNNMGVKELFALMIKEPLSAVVDPRRNTLMVIDGLDESEYQGRNELLDVIANQFCKLPIWIRFLVTTRPALHIEEKLKHLKPLELKFNDEDNLQDVRLFCLKRLQHVVKQGNLGEFVERLVLKSEGLLLYAHFLIISISEKESIFHEEDLFGSLPLGISSVYHSYFKRLERELLHELDIKEEHFLNLLSAVTASREPLPVGFVSKVLVPDTNLSLTTCKVLSAPSSVSALLPIRDDCLHVIHKSVKDFLTETSGYGEHEFIVDENKGHRIIADLCTEELDDVKLKGVDNVQFSDTKRYALHHGVPHMLNEGISREPQKLNELTKTYIINLEIVLAKIRVNGTIVAEDLLWLKKCGIFTMLSKENQIIVDNWLFLLQKQLRRFKNTPGSFLQTPLNQGGKVLTFETSNRLRKNYSEIPCMEDVDKKTQQGGAGARFRARFKLSYNMLYDMLFEGNDGRLHLWPPLTCQQVWKSPVLGEKSFKAVEIVNSERRLPSVDGSSSLRSVVFHPTTEPMDLLRGDAFAERLNSLRTNAETVFQSNHSSVGPRKEKKCKRKEKIPISGERAYHILLVNTK